MITEIAGAGKQNKIILGRIRHSASFVGLLIEFTVEYFVCNCATGWPTFCVFTNTLYKFRSVFRFYFGRGVVLISTYCIFPLLQIYRTDSAELLSLVLKDIFSYIWNNTIDPSCHKLLRTFTDHIYISANGNKCYCKV
jgi:hypothetical protein